MVTASSTPSPRWTPRVGAVKPVAEVEKALQIPVREAIQQEALKPAGNPVIESIPELEGDGDFEFRIADEDVHMAIEAALTERMRDHGVFAIESISPPPTGDLSIKDARALVGDSMGIIGGIEPTRFLDLHGDDLRDGGAGHFADCIAAIRHYNPAIKIEILVPDFRGRMDRAIDEMSVAPPDVFNHNLETVPRLYKQCRPGSDYQWSLDLLQRFKQSHPDVSTKSGLMLGLGENMDEVVEVMRDMRAHDVDMLTLGQYLQPSKHHLPVERYVDPEEFDALYRIGMELGFKHVASGPMVRSSYHADLQAHGEFSG